MRTKEALGMLVELLTAVPLHVDESELVLMRRTVDPKSVLNLWDQLSAPVEAIQ